MFTTSGNITISFFFWGGGYFLTHNVYQPLRSKQDETDRWSINAGKTK